ncbi:Mediator of RNA polymerase II transcription subunit 7, partial [Teratosphaeriaceae sp. CCFEE 6253]
PMKAAFPAPPPFYKHFTSDNLASLRRLRKEAGIPTHQPTNPSSPSNLTNTKLDILALPPALRYLISPLPPPTTQPFHTFGTPHTLISPPPTLTSISPPTPQLYPPNPLIHLNPQAHLITLARSQLTTFLALLGNLSANPAEGWEDEVEELRVITFNMLDLINLYRPHQARETLIREMEDRVRGLRGECEGVAELGRRVREVVGGFGDGKGMREGKAGGQSDGALGEDAEDAGAERKQRQRAAWAALKGLEKQGG